jgi:hypothetical protein
VHPFSPDIVHRICQQCKLTIPIVRLALTSFLNNYITLETDSNSLAAQFEPLMVTLQNLIVNKGQNNVARINLETIIKLVEKYPEARSAELLMKISKTKFQNLAIVLLTVSDEETKEVVFEVEEAIIDKTIWSLQGAFFELFSMEVLYQLAQGIEYRKTSIIERSLKILSKIVEFAPKPVLKKL